MQWDATGYHEYDIRKTATAYDWTIKQPISETTDPDGLALTTRYTFDSGGRLVSQTNPAGGGSDTTPSTRVTVYYSGIENEAYPQCGGHAEWDGKVCLTKPGGQPSSGAELPTTSTTYNFYGSPLSTEESTSAGTLRTTTIAYDLAGRPVDSTISANGLGQALERRHTVYDASSRQAVRSHTLDGSATVTAEIIRTFDTLGRQTPYTDADGNVSTATYDIGSRVATTNDGLATRTYTYDGGSERRGLPTQVVDSLAGTFTASYDLDGNVVAQTWPNGVTVQTSFDEADDAIGVNYSLPGCGTSDCTLYTESAQLGVHGEWLTRTSTLSTQVYAHDNAGRLTQVNDTVDGQCTVRVYAFDTATNRTGLTTYNPGSGGACQTSASAGATTWTYDAADRASGSGYIYDALGRTLTMPGSDTAIPGGGTETMTYHVNDMVRSINQGSRTTIYTLDVVANRIRSWTDDTTGSTVTKINHYTNDGDSPSWTYEGGASLSRIMIGLDGMVGTQNSDVDRAWTIANLHGDLVAGMDSTSVGLIYTSEYDENGQPRNSVDAGTRRYGYLGSAQRAADTPGGLSLMGARLYAPGSGRFLSTDPITGGSCNAYEYACGDPAGSSDISGTSNAKNPGGGSYAWFFCRINHAKHWRNWGFHAHADVKCTLPDWYIDAWATGLTSLKDLMGALGGQSRL